MAVLKSRAITPLIHICMLYNILVLGCCISASTTGNGPDSPSFEIIFISDSGRIGLVFLWTLIPVMTLLISVYNLLRCKTIDARRAAYSAGACMSLFFMAFLLWGQCSYFGLANVCYAAHDFSTWPAYRDTGRYLAPWLALLAIFVYLTFLILALVALRRQRKIALHESHQQFLIAEKEKASFDSSEISFGSTTNQTLPSRPRSMVPSRQLSLAQHSTRPPTYYSNGDDSLLTVDEKDETRGSVGYV